MLAGMVLNYGGGAGGRPFYTSKGPYGLTKIQTGALFASWGRSAVTC